LRESARRSPDRHAFSYIKLALPAILITAISHFRFSSRPPLIIPRPSPSLRPLLQSKLILFTVYFNYFRPFSYCSDLINAIFIFQNYFSYFAFHILIPVFLNHLHDFAIHSIIIIYFISCVIKVILFRKLIYQIFFLNKLFSDRIFQTAV
jgi:hypothetical protein